VFNKDLELMVKVEGLWMVIHQKFCILAFRTTFLGIAKRFVMEMKGRKMNSYMYYGEWTN